MRLLSLALLSALATPALVAGARAQEYVEIPGGGNWVTDVSADGEVVVGLGPSPAGAFIWRWRVDAAPTYIGEDAYAVSADGQVVAGTMYDPSLGADVAARWTAATGWQSLGYLPNAGSCPSRSNVLDMSDDGSTIVGLSWDGCDGRGFVWTEATGMLELEPLAPNGNRASVVSRDGAVIAGFTKGTLASRTPAYWAPDTSGAALDPLYGGEVNGLSGDGSLSVGTLFFSGDEHYAAFVRDGSGAITRLGMLNPGEMAGRAVDVAEDGQTIAGYDYIGNARQAWVWTAGEGIVSLNDRLAGLGVNVPRELLTTEALSDDGRVVVGTALLAQGETVGYIATLGPDDAWVGLGGGSSGVAGVPSLTASGSLVGGTPVSLALRDAAPSAPTLGWLAFSSTPAPALGGTLHATPYDLQLVFTTSARGSLDLATTWPTGVPVGTELWVQFVVADASVPAGLVLSDAVRGTTP